MMIDYSKRIGKMRPCRSFIFTALWILGSFSSVSGQEWKSVKGTKLYSISGMALISQYGKQTRYLVVHDNKQAGEPRLAIITDEPGLAPKYEAIAWPDSSPPVDAEAISSLPGHDNSFVVASSAGKLFHISLDTAAKTVRVLHVFSFPDIAPDNNYEGLSFRKINGNILAVWGHRGLDSQPGILYWGLFDPLNYAFTSTGSDTIRVPYPLDNVRHISDIKLDPSGLIYIVSAADTGDDGPFRSAFYVSGSFSIEEKRVVFRNYRTFYPLMKFDYHKIEAMEFVPGPDGGIIFGSDDENLGCWIYTTW